MTPHEIFQKIQTTSRVLPEGQTWHSGTILPNGRFMAIRQTDYNEIHNDLFYKLGFTLDHLMKLGCVRKMHNNYQFDVDNPMAKELIESDIMITNHVGTDRINCSNRDDCHWNLRFTYQDFVDNGFKLPNPRRDTYFL
jgi:hypothetical protein